MDSKSTTYFACITVICITIVIIGIIFGICDVIKNGQNAELEKYKLQKNEVIINE